MRREKDSEKRLRPKELLKERLLKSELPRERDLLRKRGSRLRDKRSSKRRTTRLK